MKSHKAILIKIIIQSGYMQFKFSKFIFFNHCQYTTGMFEIPKLLLPEKNSFIKYSEIRQWL